MPGISIKKVGQSLFKPRLRWQTLSLRGPCGVTTCRSTQPASILICVFPAKPQGIHTRDVILR